MCIVCVWLVYFPSDFKTFSFPKSILFVMFNFVIDHQVSHIFKQITKIILFHHQIKGHVIQFGQFQPSPVFPGNQIQVCHPCYLW